MPQDKIPNPQDGESAIAELLASSKTIAVVGLSSKPFRPSFGVSQYLQSAGYRIIPVNPNESLILGEKCYARLEDIPEKIDIVDIFRRSELVPEVADAAIRIGARAIWMQEGVENEPAAARARSAGLFVVMDLCIAKELHKLHTQYFAKQIPTTLAETPVYRARQKVLKVHNREGFLVASILGMTKGERLFWE